MEDVVGQDNNACFGTGSVAGAVIGTFLTTILLLAVAGLLYRQWRRHKGKHLVLVTDPEIVEDAYAFDNPCFKDGTPSVARIMERPISMMPTENPVKDSARWSTPWTSLGLGSGNRNDKRRTLDDSCLGPKATRVSVVSLRSRDFTGLGFNVCGNMREGIFVKDLLHRGPASESGRIHPGDRIASVKISFRNMVYEDALTILSYASPYDVELEVESGGSGSKPTTLLKKTVGPSPSRICHPLYRSQSIPELSQANKNSAKRLFIADPNETIGSNYSTMNSTIKSSKSTPGSQTLERRHDETKNNHHKFGIKVLPALDGTVHRIENQNEHNTNLERRHSKKIDAEKRISTTNSSSALSENTIEDAKICSENLQQKSNQYVKLERRHLEAKDTDVLENSNKSMEESINIPSEVPAEVHNAAMAARRNRKNSSEILNEQNTISMESGESEGPKSPQKNKRKAPAPPKSKPNEIDVTTMSTSKDVSPQQAHHVMDRNDTIDSISDYTESLNDYVIKVRETTDDVDTLRPILENHVIRRRNSESDTDSEIQNSFTTIELNPADITIHCIPVPEVNNDGDDDDENDMYRKAASLGDLSKYKSKTSTNLERAQSLDMTDTGSKKRKAPLPPEDINESTEDLTKLDHMDTFERCKLKKSSEWGTLEDVLWTKNNEVEEKSKKPRIKKKNNNILERSKSAVEIKLKDEAVLSEISDKIDVSDTGDEISIELFNLPLSKQLTQEFIHAERMFNPDEDNSLARIVNDGLIVKSPTLEDIELDFRQAKPLPDEDINESSTIDTETTEDNEINDDFNKALRYFEMHSSKSPVLNESIKVNLSRLDEWREESINSVNDDKLYAGKKAVIEEPATKIITDKRCRACDEMSNQQEHNCEKHIIESNKDQVFQQESSQYNKKSMEENMILDSLQSVGAKDRIVGWSSTPTHVRSSVGSKSKAISKVYDTKSIGDINVELDDSVSSFYARRTKFEQKSDQREKSPTKLKSPTSSTFETHFARRVINVSNRQEHEQEEDEGEEEDEYEFGSNITVNSKNFSSPIDDRHNISNVSVSSGENSEDSGLVRESIDYNPQEAEIRPPLPDTPVPNMPQRTTYITEIKVSPNRENFQEPNNDTEEMMAVVEHNSEPRKLVQQEITVTSNGKPTSGKKPPVPPRRADITKVPKEDTTEKQILYVSEYKSTTDRNSQMLDINPIERKPETINKKFENWIFLRDNKEQNRWENGSSQPQPITNIVLSSGEDNITHQ